MALNKYINHQERIEIFVNQIMTFVELVFLYHYQLGFMYVIIESS